MSDDERTALMNAGPPTGADPPDQRRGRHPHAPAPAATTTYYADYEPTPDRRRAASIAIGIARPVVLGLLGFDRPT